MITRYEFSLHENAYIGLAYGKYQIQDGHGFFFVESEIPKVILGLYNKDNWHDESDYNYFTENKLTIEKLTFGGKQCLK